MDFYKVPIGFGMALAMNPLEINAYSATTEEQNQAILERAHNARSEKEMRDIANVISGKPVESSPATDSPNRRLAYYTGSESWISGISDAVSLTHLH